MASEPSESQNTDQPAGHPTGSKAPRLLSIVRPLFHQWRRQRRRLRELLQWHRLKAFLTAGVRGLTGRMAQPSGDNMPTADLRATIGGLNLRRLGLSLLGLLLCGYLFSGFYTVQPGEVAVVRRFGHILSPPIPEGLHYRLPRPLEVENVVSISTVYRESLGVPQNTKRQRRRGSVAELEVLSGDVNIVDFEIIAHYQVQDPVAYLFNINADPSHLVRDTVRAALLPLSGSTDVDALLTTKRQPMQKTLRRDVQALLDKYQSGLVIRSINIQKAYPANDVAEAFRDIASAMEDKVRAVNEAEAYRNSVLPEARGQSVDLIAKAESDAAEFVDLATGAAVAFDAIVAQYHTDSQLYGEEVTRWRLYLEQMEKSLPNLQTYVIQRGDHINLRLLNGVQVIPPLPLDRKPDKAK